MCYNDYIIYKKKGEIYTSKKSLRAVSGVTLAVALVQTVQLALADESANSNSVVVKSEKLTLLLKKQLSLVSSTTTTKRNTCCENTRRIERLKSEES